MRRESRAWCVFRVQGRFGDGDSRRRCILKETEQKSRVGCVLRGGEFGGGSWSEDDEVGRTDCMSPFRKSNFFCSLYS